jgi:hypothetical protein
MAAIYPRVRALAKELGAKSCAHLTKPHQTDYLNAFARTIQRSVDDWFYVNERVADTDWPIALSPEAKKASQALTESGDSVAHQGEVDK